MKQNVKRIIVLSVISSATLFGTAHAALGSYGTSYSMPSKSSTIHIARDAYDGKCKDTDSCFNSSDLTVSAGQKVIWINDDAVSHTVTSTDNASSNFDSGKIMSGDSYNVQFNDPGIFYYHCNIHPWMAGIVNVK